MQLTLCRLTLLKTKRKGKWFINNCSHQRNLECRNSHNLRKNTPMLGMLKHHQSDTARNNVEWFISNQCVCIITVQIQMDTADKINQNWFWPDAVNAIGMSSNFTWFDLILIESYDEAKLSVLGLKPTNVVTILTILTWIRYLEKYSKSFLILQRKTAI